MLANRLQLNTGKTELLWCATSRRRQQLPTSALRIGLDLVSPSASVRDQGHLLRRPPQHEMPRSENSCQLLRRFTPVPTSVYQTLVVALVLSVVTAGLRQCCAGGLTSLPVQSPAVGTQRCCSIDRRPATF